METQIDNLAGFAEALFLRPYVIIATLLLATVMLTGTAARFIDFIDGLR